jgi:hypothetical protein
MRDFNANAVEEYGFKANQMGFFKRWQQMTSSISQNEELTLDEAAERAYIQLKLQGSE